MKYESAQSVGENFTLKFENGTISSLVLEIPEHLGIFKAG